METWLTRDNDANTLSLDPKIRKVVLSSLDERFDYHLSQAENLRLLFTAMNDEAFEIRELAFSTTGRLASRNPAYVLPSLRKTLTQLLTELGNSCLKVHYWNLLFLS